MHFVDKSEPKQTNNFNSKICVIVYQCADCNAMEDNNNNNSKDNKQTSDWKVGVRLDWNDETPALQVLLRSIDTYFMMHDFNNIHQHAVVLALPSDTALLTERLK